MSALTVFLSAMAFAAALLALLTAWLDYQLPSTLSLEEAEGDRASPAAPLAVSEGSAGSPSDVAASNAAQ